MTLNLVLRSVGRVLCFAVAGACGMALVGIVAGSVAGALVVFVENVTRPSRFWGIFHDVPAGAEFGAVYAKFIGLWSGAISFAIAGYFACFSILPQKVFAKAFRLAWRAALVGVIMGAVLGPINFFFLGRFTPLNLRDPFIGYVCGVTGGCVIGTFYGAIVGARREIARQKLEQNAVLSTVESTA